MLGLRAGSDISDHTRRQQVREMYTVANTRHVTRTPTRVTLKCQPVDILSCALSEGSSTRLALRLKRISAQLVHGQRDKYSLNVASARVYTDDGDIDD